MMNFKQWLEGQPIGGIEPVKERPEVLIGPTHSGFNSTERPPTKANNFKMKKAMKNK